MAIARGNVNCLSLLNQIFSIYLGTPKLRNAWKNLIKKILSLEGIILLLSMISNGSLFLFPLFLNVNLTVLLGEKVRLLSANHASNLLVAPCNALNATLWFLVVMCIARSSIKNDPSTPFTSSYNIPLIATRKRHTLQCNSQVCLCVFCKMDPPTLTNQFSDELRHSSLYSHVF